MILNITVCYPGASMEWDRGSRGKRVFNLAKNWLSLECSQDKGSRTFSQQRWKSPPCPHDCTGKLTSFATNLQTGSITLLLPHFLLLLVFAVTRSISIVSEKWKKGLQKMGKKGCFEDFLITIYVGGKWCMQSFVSSKMRLSLALIERLCACKIWIWSCLWKLSTWKRKIDRAAKHLWLSIEIQWIDAYSLFFADFEYGVIKKRCRGSTQTLARKGAW